MICARKAIRVAGAIGLTIVTSLVIVGCGSSADTSSSASTSTPTESTTPTKSTRTPTESTDVPGSSTTSRPKEQCDADPAEGILYYNPRLGFGTATRPPRPPEVPSASPPLRSVTGTAAKSLYDDLCQFVTTSGVNVRDGSATATSCGAQAMFGYVVDFGKQERGDVVVGLNPTGCEYLQMGTIVAMQGGNAGPFETMVDKVATAFGVTIDDFGHGDVKARSSDSMSTSVASTGVPGSSTTSGPNEQCDAEPAEAVLYYNPNVDFGTATRPPGLPEVPSTSPPLRSVTSAAAKNLYDDLCQFGTMSGANVTESSTQPTVCPAQAMFGYDIDFGKQEAGDVVVGLNPTGCEYLQMGTIVATQAGNAEPFEAMVNELAAAFGVTIDDFRHGAVKAG